MNVTNHSIIEEKEALAWLKANLSKPSKGTLFFDAKCINDPIVRVLMDNPDLYKNLSAVVVNGNPGKEFLAFSSFDNAPSLACIHKVIETPIKISIVISKKAYLYRDGGDVIRSSNDNVEIGKLLESIHGHFQSLSW